MGRQLLCLGLLALSVAAATARADIYRFVDSAGVVHLTNVPDDPRYRLVLKTPAFKHIAADPANAPRPPVQSAKFDGMIEKAARAAAVRPELVRAVIAVESAFNPRAISKKGAVGLMQLQPDTARRYGASNAFDPEQNVRAGAHYLGDLMARYDNQLELALAAYNAGEAAVERYGRRIPPFAETREYVPAVLRIYRSLIGKQRAD